MRKEVIEKAINKYGLLTQSVVAMEECAELAQAVSKCIRAKDFIPTNEHENLCEEMADVLICIEMLKIMYHVSEEEVNDWIEAKVNRLEKRADGK